MPGLVKRSLMIAGHRTSVALEPEFWAVLDHAAGARAVPLAVLVAEIDHARASATPDRLLASACRVFALETVRKGAP